MRSKANPIEDAIAQQRWLSPGLARKLLGINEATLRHWTDSGLIRSFRTPGGHRRVSAEDIRQLIEQGKQDRREPSRNIPQVVIPRIRRKLSGHEAGMPQWLAQFDASGQEQMRILGRQLLEVCLENLGRSRPQEAMARARAMGVDYEAVATRQGLSLPSAIQAFVFFRSTMLEALRPELLRRFGSTYELSRCWQQLGRITDEVLLSMTQTFQSSSGT